MCSIRSDDSTSQCISSRKLCKYSKSETCTRMFIAESFITVEMESWSMQGLTNNLPIWVQLHLADKTNTLEFLNLKTPMQNEKKSRCIIINVVIYVKFINTQNNYICCLWIHMYEVNVFFKRQERYIKATWLWLPLERKIENLVIEGCKILHLWYFIYLKIKVWNRW